jgi:hypothetical protein
MRESGLCVVSAVSQSRAHRDVSTGQAILFRRTAEVTSEG